MGVRALLYAPSTWTLAGPGAHPNMNSKPRSDPPRQDTLDADELGPQDPSAGSPLTTAPEPPTSASKHKASVAGEPEPQGPAGPGSNSPPQAQSNPPPARRPVGRFRKIMKSEPFFSRHVSIQKRRDHSHTIEELSCF